MRTHFYISSDSKEIKKIGEQIRHFPLSDKFIRSGSPVLSSGEIRPTNIVPIIAPDRKGNADEGLPVVGRHLRIETEDV